MSAQRKLAALDFLDPLSHLFSNFGELFIYFLFNQKLYRFSNIYITFYFS